MKIRKCKICKKRDATSQHAKDYNHKLIDIPGNRARLCNWCHIALHQLNHKNFLEWDFLMSHRKKEIIKQADLLEKKHNSLRNKGRANDLDSDPFDSPTLPQLNTKEVKQ